MLKKLRAKFIIFIMVILVAMMGALVDLMGASASKSLARESEKIMSGRSIIYNMANPLSPLVQEMYDRVYPSYFALSSAEDAPVFSYGEVTVDLTDPAMRAQLYQAAADSSRNSGILRQYRLRFLKRELSGYIIFSDATEELASRTHLWREYVLFGVSGLAVLLFISLLISKSVLKPTEDAWAQQKQFIADASHELKTPVAVMLTNAELLTGDGTDPESQKKYAENILTSARQMRTLVEHLLELARIDSNSAAPQTEPLDFSELVADSLLPFEPVFFEQGLMLTDRLEPGIHVSGSRNHLEQLMDILLDNAQKYSTPGGSVEVRLTRSGRACLLSVMSPGETLSPQELRAIFKRFYTADRSHSNGSYGLGLAIADSIVQFHHGKIWAESADNLNTFYVQLPVLG